MPASERNETFRRFAAFWRGVGEILGFLAAATTAVFAFLRGRPRGPVAPAPRQATSLPSALPRRLTEVLGQIGDGWDTFAARSNEERRTGGKPPPK